MRSPELEVRPKRVALNHSEKGRSLGAAAWRFATGGGLCFAVNLGVLWLATEKWKWHYLAALALSWCIVLVLGFFLHRQWTFRAANSPLRLSYLWSEARRYLAVNVGHALISTALMAMFVSGFHVAPWLASLGVAALLMSATFFLHRNWSLRVSEEQERERIAG